MSTSGVTDVILEILRIGLLAIRVKNHTPARNEMQELIIREWIELCHTIPPMLIGKCSAPAVNYFLEVQGAAFLRNYPQQEDTMFLQAGDLLRELREKCQNQ